MATINDVARAAGVSSTTVSHVLNKTRKVNRETAERVMRAVRELDYAPSSLARGLRTKSSRTLGVVSDYATNPFFAEVVGGIEELCAELDFAFYVSFSKLSSERELGLIADLARRGVEGLILHSCSADAELGQLIERLAVPAVLFQRSDPGWHADALCTDDAAGARAVMEHLTALGHRRIAYLGGYTYPSHSARRREAVYRSYLLESGIGVDERLVGNGDYSFEGGYRAAALMLGRDRPTAFFCMADQVALGCLAAVQDAGLRVPDDVSIVGWDNLAFLDYLHPSLTSVDHQASEQGRLMASRLLARIRNPGMPHEVISVSPRLVVRATTARRP